MDAARPDLTGSYASTRKRHARKPSPLPAGLMMLSGGPSSNITRAKYNCRLRSARSRGFAAFRRRASSVSSEVSDPARPGTPST